MTAAPSNRMPLLFGLTVALALVAAGAAWALWPEAPEPEPEVAADTGLTRDETEDQMRTIGYVQ